MSHHALQAHVEQRRRGLRFTAHVEKSLVAALGDHHRRVDSFAHVQRRRLRHRWNDTGRARSERRGGHMRWPARERRATVALKPHASKAAHASPPANASPAPDFDLPKATGAIATAAAAAASQINTCCEPCVPDGRNQHQTEQPARPQWNRPCWPRRPHPSIARDPRVRRRGSQRQWKARAPQQRRRENSTDDARQVEIEVEPGTGRKPRIHGPTGQHIRERECGPGDRDGQQNLASGQR